MAVEERTRRGDTRREPTNVEQWQLVAAGALLVAGVFSDGWAHTNLLDELEGFITPWHGVIFAGFLACVAVLTVASIRRVRPGDRPFDALPRQWRVAALGAATFAVGFLGDGIWHTVYGLEADFEALMSPTHLTMLVGAVWVLSGPVAARWHDDDAGARAIGPVLASSTLILALTSFFLVWIWPLNTGVTNDGFAVYVARQPISAAGTLDAFGEVVGVAGYLIFSVVLVAPVVVLGTRWRLPRGSIVLLTMVPWIGLSAAFTGGDGSQRLLAPLAAALVAESLLSRLEMDRPLSWWILGALTPATLVAVDFVVIAMSWGIGWEPELVAGSVVMSGLIGAAVAMVGRPPRYSGVSAGS